MNTTPHDLRDTLHLAAGAQRLLWLPAGIELHACRGTLSVQSGPRTYGQIVCRHAQLLHAGQSQAVDEAGWYLLTAHGDHVDVICAAWAEPSGWIDTLARRIAGSLRLRAARRPA